jgi:uncharacterized protein YbjT (DUF2867 family)
MKVILTGATGMVGEGVLLACLENPSVTEILMINRRAFPLQNPKLKEILVTDFMKLENFSSDLQGYDACFFCAGISSIGLKEPEYTHITYDITLHVAKVLVDLNPKMVFTYVSGALTDSSEKGKSMWARVKGKTENDLMKLPFKGVYNFRPGFMKPVAGQSNVKWFFKPVIWIFPILLPSQTLTLYQVAQAMINAVEKGFNKQVLEIKDIKELAKS